MKLNFCNPNSRNSFSLNNLQRYYKKQYSFMDGLKKHSFSLLLFYWDTSLRNPIFTFQLYNLKQTN